MTQLIATAAILIASQTGADWKPRPDIKIGGSVAQTGKVKRAPTVEPAAVNKALTDAAGLTKMIQWETLATLAPERTAYMGCHLSFYKPSCVDAGGIADMLGMPGGWHSEPGDDQSYLGVWMQVSGTGKRYGLSFEIWRYEADAGPADFVLKVAGKTFNRKLTGSGILNFSFTPTQAGQYMAELRMKSTGRFLFRKVDIKTSVL